MSFTRFFIAAPIALATLIAPMLSISSQAQSIQSRSDVQAVQQTKRATLPVRISGYLPDTNGNYNVPCSQLQVSLIELKDQPPMPDRFSIPEEVLMASAPAIFVKEDGTCQYELTFRQPASTVRFVKPRTYVVKVNGGGYQGSYLHQTQTPIENDSLFNIPVAPIPPVAVPR
ncbi:hypothetical protein ACN4EG_26810 [Alkalinema pantanalense CENA528]|uniref:hypothetical protein n=1 Tax=Alkalinema pantanalense TaxID=1620705 RepID=UPI003D70227B